MEMNHIDFSPEVCIKLANVETRKIQLPAVWDGRELSIPSAILCNATLLPLHSVAPVNTVVDVAGPASVFINLLKPCSAISPIFTSDITAAHLCVVKCDR